MHFICKYLIICLSIILSEAQEHIVCDKKSEEKMDQLAMELSTFGDPNGKYPSNQNELNIDCKNDKMSVKWMNTYVDGCLKGMANDLTSMLVKDLEIVVKKYCDSPKLSKLFISWAKCGNSAINQTVKCWHQYILDMERISAGKDKIVDKDEFGLICCHYYRFDHCVEDSFLSLGDSRCPTASVEGLHSILNEISGRMIENFCGDYTRDSDKCDSLINQYKHLNDIELTKPLRKSPVKPFVEILDNSQEVIDFRKDTKTEIN